jgi:hypothetical protein
MEAEIRYSEARYIPMAVGLTFSRQKLMIGDGVTAKTCGELKILVLKATKDGKK